MPMFGSDWEDANVDAPSTLDKLISEVNKQYKSDIIKRGTDLPEVQRISFSSPRVNYMTYGGIPIGKATEFFGAEGGGKTTSALDITGKAQHRARDRWNHQLTTLKNRLNNLLEKNNKGDQKEIKELQERIPRLQAKGPRRVVYVDTENTLDESWAELNGVDTTELILVRPEAQTAEQVLQMMLDMLKTGDVELMVLDSIPMLVSQNVFTKTLEDKQYAGIADAMSRFSAMVAPVLARHQTALIMINQSREDLENPYNQFKTPGGRALKHLYALRLFFRKGSFLDEGNNEVPQRTEDPAGNIVDVTVVKTKVCKPDRRIGSYTIKYDTGVDYVSDTVTLALKYDLISLSGAWYSIIDPETGELLANADGELKFQGKAKLLAYLRDDEEMFAEIYDAVHVKMGL